MALSRVVAVVAVVAVGLAMGAAAWSACSPFQDGTPPAVEDAAVPAEGGPLPDVDGGVDVADAGPVCVLLLPRSQIDFEAGFGDLETKTKRDGGDIFIENGALVATVPLTNAQADVRRVISNLGGVLGQARLSFVLKDLVSGPAGSFAEVGCSVELRQANNTYASMRFELQDGNLRLDDIGRLDGSAAETGVGPIVALTNATPQTVGIDVVIDVDPQQTKFVSRARVSGDTMEYSNETRMAGQPTSVTLRCGILNFNPSTDDDVGQGYRLTIDDVKLELCKRVP